MQLLSSDRARLWIENGRMQEQEEERANGKYNAKLSDVPVAYSAQVSFTDCSVD